MAAIPVVISGILWDQQQKKGTRVTLIGLQTKAGLKIGGGPIIDQTPPEVEPPDLGIWEDPGGYNPDNPSHPVPPDKPREPKIEWHTAWSEDTGWVIIGTQTGDHVTPSRK